MFVILIIHFDASVLVKDLYLSNSEMYAEHNIVFETLGIT